ncbi:unnamed protein product [Peniophora sp. CBMAI 1063]|nr:unnamed protein product [Peniophora sp. CBMAI 1063]
MIAQRWLCGQHCVHLRQPTTPSLSTPICNSGGPYRRLDCLHAPTSLSDSTSTKRTHYIPERLSEVYLGDLFDVDLNVDSVWAGDYTGPLKEFMDAMPSLHTLHTTECYLENLLGTPTEVLGNFTRLT